MSEATTKAKSKAKKKAKAPPAPPPIPFRDRGLVGIDEIADHLGVCAKTIRREIERGKFPECDRRIGRRILWEPSTVVAAIGKQRGR